MSRDFFGGKTKLRGRVKGRGKGVNMVISTAKRALASNLRKQGLSIREIADKVNSNKTSVGEWLKGIESGQDRTGQDRSSVRPSTLKPTVRTVPPDRTGQQGQRTGLVRSVPDGQSKSRGRTVQSLAGRTGHSGRTGQKSMSNNGGYIVIYFVTILLIVFLLDHFFFEGKLLAYIRFFFLKEEEAKEIPLEKVPESQGFLGRSEEDL